MRYWVLGYDGALCDSALNAVHLYENTVPFGVISHLFILFGKIDHKITESGVHL